MEDVLDEIREDEERLKERKEKRKIDEERSREYLDEQHAFKEKLKREAKEKEKERRKNLGLPEEEEVVESPEEIARKRKENQKLIQEYQDKIDRASARDRAAGKKQPDDARDEFKVAPPGPERGKGIFAKKDGTW